MTAIYILLALLAIAVIFSFVYTEARVDKYEKLTHTIAHQIREVSYLLQTFSMEVEDCRNRVNDPPQRTINIDGEHYVLTHRKPDETFQPCDRCALKNNCELLHDAGLCDYLGSTDPEDYWQRVYL